MSAAEKPQVILHVALDFFFFFLSLASSSHAALMIHPL